MQKLWSSIAILIVFCILSVLLSFHKEKNLIVVVAADYGSRYAAIGNSVLFGAEYGYRKAGSGSLPNDFTLKIQSLSDQGDPKNAEKVALQAVSRPEVIAVIGHSSSGETEAALKVYTPYEMPIFLPVATKPSLTSEQNGVHNVYRLVPQDNLQASTVAKFCKEKLLSQNLDNKSKNVGNDKISGNNKKSTKMQSVAIIDDGTVYGISLSKSLHEALSNEGIRSTMLESGEDKQWAKSVESVDPNIVVFAGYYSTGGKLINQLRVNKLNQPIILTDGCFPSPIFNEIKQDPKEVYISFIAEDWNEKESANELMNDAKSQSNIDPSFAPFAADSFHIIYDAVRHIVSNGQERVDRKILLNYLKENRKYDDKSYIAGPYNFGKSGDNDSGQHHIYKMNTVKSQSHTKSSWEMIK
jgi:branched-chain amino acid transport system substrate-binding protein